MSAASSTAIAGRILIFIVVADLVYILNCLAPYLGLKFENSQAMYSQLDARARNHLLVPAQPLREADYIREVELEVPVALEDEVAGLRWFLRAANESGRSIHLPFLDHHFARICEAQPTAPIRLRYVTGDGVVTRHDDVCSNPELRDPFPIGLFPACDPECYGELEIWASGRWHDPESGGAAP